MKAKHYFLRKLLLQYLDSRTELQLLETQFQPWSTNITENQRTSSSITANKKGKAKYLFFFKINPLSSYAMNDQRLTNIHEAKYHVFQCKNLLSLWHSLYKPNRVSIHRNGETKDRFLPFNTVLEFPQELLIILVCNFDQPLKQLFSLLDSKVFNIYLTKYTSWRTR